MQQIQHCWGQAFEAIRAVEIAINNHKEASQERLLTLHHRGQKIQSTIEEWKRAFDNHTSPSSPKKDPEERPDSRSRGLRRRTSVTQADLEIMRQEARQATYEWTRSGPSGPDSASLEEERKLETSATLQRGD